MALMTYEEFLKKENFSQEELLAHAWGHLIEDAPSELGWMTAPPLMMINRVVELEADGPKGRIVAEQDVHLADWFFQCHFRKDPVLPGSLNMEAIWQTLAIYGWWRGALGYGMDLGTKEIEFFGQIRPHNRIVRYEIDICEYKEFKNKKAATVTGNANVIVDGEHIYNITEIRFGFFKDIHYANYPNKSANSIGGVMEEFKDLT